MDFYGLPYTKKQRNKAAYCFQIFLCFCSSVSLFLGNFMIFFCKNLWPKNVLFQIVFMKKSYKETEIQSNRHIFFGKKIQRNQDTELHMLFFPQKKSYKETKIQSYICYLYFSQTKKLQRNEDTEQQTHFLFFGKLNAWA